MPVNTGTGADTNTTQDGSVNSGTALNLDSLKTELFAELNKAVNGMAKGLKGDILKALKPEPETHGEGSTGTETTTVTPKAPAKEIKDLAEANARFLDMDKELGLLRKTVKESQDREKAATEAKLESDRVTAWKSALADIPFLPGVRDGAFDISLKNVKRQEDGDFLYASEKGLLPLKDAAKQTFIEGNFSWMVQPKGAGGAGATNGSGKVQTKDINVEELTPGQIRDMKPEDKAALYADVARAAAETRR